LALAIDKPVIAMIHGVCIGAGLAVALEADLRIAADDARLGIPVARLGSAFPLEQMRKVVALVGPSSASMLSFTADNIHANEALRIGLVDRVVEKATLHATVAELAQRIAARAPLSVRASKVTIRASWNNDPDTVEQCRALVAACQASDDAVEGKTAFLEKRAPRFRGR
jgi:enoyl-CoA hydratase/carnithine racemase